MQPDTDLTLTNLVDYIRRYIYSSERLGNNYFTSEIEARVSVSEAYVITGEFSSAFRCIRENICQTFAADFVDDISRLIFFVTLFRIVGWSDLSGAISAAYPGYDRDADDASRINFFSLEESSTGIDALISDPNEMRWLIKSLNYMFVLALLSSGKDGGGTFWALSQFPREYKSVALEVVELSRLGRYSGSNTLTDIDFDTTYPGVFLQAGKISETAWRLRSKAVALELHSYKSKKFAEDEVVQRMKDWVRLAVNKPSSISLPGFSRDDYLAWSWSLRCAYDSLEPGTILLLSKLARHIDWFLDGGAHIGYLSSVISRFNSRCHLIAVEPNVDLFGVLSRNLATFGGKHIPCALSEEAGVKHFFPGTGHSNGSLLHGATSSTVEPVEVDADTIDNLLAGVAGKGLIKLDLEGHELEALKGATKTLQRSDLVILLEINPRLLKKKSESIYEVSRLLEKYGFYGRCVTDSFDLLVPEFVDDGLTRNYLFCKPPVWSDVLSRLS